MVLFDIEERDVDYKLLYTDVANTLLKSTETSKFYCDAGLCDVTQLLTTTTTSLSKRTIGVNSTYSNTTYLITTIWGMLDGNNADVTYKVWHNPLGSNTLVCNTSVTATGGTFTCNMSGRQGVAQVTLDVAGNSFSWTEFQNLVSQTLRDFISQGDSMFIVIAILLVIGLSGLVSPVAVVVLTVFAVVIMATLGIFTGITAGLLVIVIVMGIMISLKVKQ